MCSRSRTGIGVGKRQLSLSLLLLVLVLVVTYLKPLLVISMYEGRMGLAEVVVHCDMIC